MKHSHLLALYNNELEDNRRLKARVEEFEAERESIISTAENMGGRRPSSASDAMDAAISALWEMGRRKADHETRADKAETRVAELQELDRQLRDRVVIAERDVRRLRQNIDGASEFDLLKARQSSGTACDEFRNQDARKLAALLRDACDRIAHIELDQSGDGGSSC